MKAQSDNIGEKLKTLRKGRKLTQQEVADRLGFKRATISNYEIGRRTPHLVELKQLASYYGVGLDYFGVDAKEDGFQFVSIATEFFRSDSISTEVKDDVFRVLMGVYLENRKKFNAKEF